MQMGNLQYKTSETERVLEQIYIIHVDFSHIDIKFPVSAFQVAIRTLVIQADQSPLFNERPLLARELPIHEAEKLSEVGAGGEVAQPHDVNTHTPC